MIKKLSALFLIFCIISLPLFSLEVAEEEIGTADPGIEFENYRGPYDIVLTLEEIFDIGRELGRAEWTIRSVDGRYTLIHAVDPEAKEGFNADIFILETGGYVDHIINVRRIIAGFLEEAYAYNPKDAMLLAKFITYYNATHRGDSEYVEGVYTKIVTDVLEADKIGIAPSYRDWPGNTMMLIPLTEKAEEGGLGSLDSDILSDEEVIEDLQEREDKGLEDRKELVDLKEREIEEEERAIEEELIALEEAERALENPEITSQPEVRPDTVAEETEETVVTEETADPVDTTREETVVREPGETETGPVEPADTAEEQPEPEDEPETVLEPEPAPEPEPEDERSIEERREELEERAVRLEERRENLDEEREEIAEDQQIVIEREEAEERTEAEAGPEEPVAEPETTVRATAVGDGTLFLLTREEGDRIYGTLVIVDFATGIFMKQSEVTTILRRRYYPYQDSFLLLYEEGGKALLGIIDTDKLALQQSSDTEVFSNSYVLIDGNDLYAVVSNSGDWKLGKFDSSLKLQASSSRSVSPNTVIVREGEYVYAQDSAGTLAAFDTESLGSGGE